MKGAAHYPAGFAGAEYLEERKITVAVRNTQTDRSARWDDYSLETYF